MTLFLLLVTIASITPLAAIAADATRLSASALAVGVSVAVILGVLQFVGHHRFAARLCDRHTVGGLPAAAVMTTYYVAILSGGIACALLTQSVARAW